jgi:sulfotransferase
MIKNFVGLSGLPRTGSTLLSAILSQNPKIHAEGNSAVCQLMWDMQGSIYGTCNEQLAASNRLDTGIGLIKNIPNIYYKDITASTVIDKCRSWTLPDNMAMLNKYFEHKPKVLVLERPMVEIVRSFVALRLANNYQGDPEEGLLDTWSEPIMRSYEGVKWAKANNNGEFLFVQYDDLLHNTKSVIEKIYKFCELEFFKHDFNNIVNKHPENDGVYGMLGQHDIRPTINKRDLDVVLTEATIKKCKAIENK